MIAFPDWSGQTAFVVASGQSAPAVVPHIPPGARVMTVNRAHELIPTASALYAADAGFWQFYASARAFQGRKFGPSGNIARICPSVEIVEIHRKGGAIGTQMVREPPGVIGGAGNSGFQAVNLVAQWRPRRICLVGFDYRGSHWHPDHPPGLRNPTDSQLATWARHLDNAASTLAGWGIQVLNLSPDSALRAYRRATLTKGVLSCQTPFV